MITKTTVPNLGSFEAYGEYFGYPACCIDAFSKLTHIGDPHLRDRPFNGTGFIPCEMCCERDPEDLLTEINARRYHPEPLTPTTLQPY